MAEVVTEELDNEYMTKFEELETHYDKFYNKEVTHVKLFFIYINEHNEIYSIKKEDEPLENACLTKERILYLIKNNQYNLLNKHKLVSLLSYNIDLHHTELNNFILNKINNNNYLSSLKILDTIKFRDTIPILTDLNSVFFIYSYSSSNNKPINTTKRIMIKPNKPNKSNKSKTRRNNSIN